MRVQYSKDGDLFIYENNQMVLLDSNVAENYVISREQGLIIYFVVDNMQKSYISHNNFVLETTGRCYIKYLNGDKMLLGENVIIKHISSDANLIVFLRNYNKQVRYTKDFSANTGELCILKNKKLIKADEFVSHIMYFHMAHGEDGVYYFKATTEISMGFSYIDFFFYSFKKNKSKSIIKKIQLSPYPIYRNDGKVEFICFRPYKNTLLSGDLFYVKDLSSRLIDKNVSNKFEIDGNITNINYLKIIEIDKYTLNYTVKNDLMEYNIEKCEINLIKENISEDEFNPKVGLSHKENISHEDYDYCLNEIKKLGLCNICDKDNYVFYFSKSQSKKYYISCDIAQKAHKHSILKNIYPLDDSENHEVIFTKNQIDTMNLLTYLYRVKIMNFELYNNFKIYGIGIMDLTKNLFNQIEFDLDYKRLLDDIYRKLIEFHGFKNKYQLEAFLQELKNIISKNNENSSYYWGRNGNKSEVTEKSLKEIEEKLILEKVIHSKWKSEAALFELIKKNFPEATMQYSPKWLSPQRIDVFIPEINCAFEYQGVQHYKQVDYFGGEENYKKRIELDKRKRQLCSENGVKLIEWHFSEPISKSILFDKLRVAGIEV